MKGSRWFVCGKGKKQDANDPTLFTSGMIKHFLPSFDISDSYALLLTCLKCQSCSANMEIKFSPVQVACGSRPSDERECQDFAIRIPAPTTNLSSTHFRLISEFGSCCPFIHDVIINT
jgi:hypothetical protein